MTLLQNQVYVRDDTYNLLWIYDVDPNEWDFVRSAAKKDDNGNLILSLPLTAALRKWDANDILSKNEQYLNDMKIPKFVIDIKEGENFKLPELNNCTNEQLEELLSILGGWRSYLEAQLSYVQSKKSILEAGFEEGLAKTMAMVSKKYFESDVRRPLKETLRGEALSMNHMLRQTRLDLIETNALCIRLTGYRDSYRSMYDAVSRVVALRLASKGE